jgi:type IV pilus biogenesis protein CpaD/CtpE
MSSFHATRLDAALRVAGVRLHGCDSRGEIHYRDEADDTDRTKAAAVLAAHDKAACVLADERDRRQRAAEDAELRAFIRERLQARGLGTG